MKIQILDIYYDPVLKNFYLKNPDIRNSPYKKSLDRLMLQSFGTADFYSHNLNLLGHDAQDVIINDKLLQTKWASEHGERRWLDWADNLHFPYSKHYFKSHWQEEILEKQILDFRPDVLYCQSLVVPGPAFLKKIKSHHPVFVVGQIASPLTFDKELLSHFDLILSSFPHFVNRFRRLGIKSEYFRIGFETRVLKMLRRKKKKFEVSFVGGFSRNHDNSAVVDVATDFWGYGFKPQNYSPEIIKKYHGEAWGIDMYNILFNSKITLNRHINVAEDHANNMRLFEATGVGTLLITDYKSDLHKLFVPGKEVETYKSKEELAEKIKYYLSHETERKRISQAGQKRTLRDHTYYQRMKELEVILKKHL